MKNTEVVQKFKEIVGPEVWYQISSFKMNQIVAFSRIYENTSEEQRLAIMDAVDEIDCIRQNKGLEYDRNYNN